MKYTLKEKEMRIDASAIAWIIIQADNEKLKKLEDIKNGL